MSEYRDLQGRKTNATDSNRMVWSSARCTFWTDDFSKLKAYNSTGIPTCPHCNSPGYESVYTSWERSAKRHDAEVKEGYYSFLQEYKEKCLQTKDGKPIPVVEAFRIWREDGKRKLNNALKTMTINESQ